MQIQPECLRQLLFSSLHHYISPANTSFLFPIRFQGWESFAISMGAGLLLALATVSYHAIKASMINPAETLKYE